MKNCGSFFFGGGDEQKTFFEIKNQGKKRFYLWRACNIIFDSYFYGANRINHLGIFAQRSDYLHLFSSVDDCLQEKGEVKETKRLSLS